MSEEKTKRMLGLFIKSVVRGVLGFEHVDGAFLGVFLVVGANCLDDIVVGTRGNGGAVVLAVPAFRGVGGVEEFLSPAVVLPEILSAVKAPSRAFLSSNSWHQALKCSQQETGHPVG